MGSARLWTVDVTPLLAQVTAPTLILHRRDLAEPPVESAGR
jgi:hypothetical protein